MSVRRTVNLVLAALLTVLAGCGQVSRPIEIEEAEAFASPEVAPLALSWSIETLDVTGMPYGPVAMASGNDGTRHIAFLEAVDDVVKHVSDQSGDWSVAETVGAAQSGYVDSGSLSIAVDGDGVPRVAYFDAVGALAYATRADGAWPLTADVVSPYANLVSLAVDANGAAHLVFKDGSGLQHAVQTSVGWSTSTVLANPASGGINSGAVALDSEGHPHVALMWNEWVSPTFWVRLGYTEGTYDADGRIGWAPLTVVAAYANATTGGSVALALDGADRPHIAYRSGFGHLTYVVHDGSAWGAPELVDMADAFAPSVALDGNGNAHVAYLVRPAGASLDALRYGVRGDTGWSTGTVDDAGDAGTPALVVDALDRPSIAYTLDEGTAPTLRHAAVAGPVADHVVTNEADDGPGSLRATVLAAPAGTTITFASTVDEVVLTSGPLVLERDVTIAGPEGGSVTLRGNDTFPIVRAFTDDIDLVLRDLTIRDGYDADFGGGVQVSWPGYGPTTPTAAPPSLRLERCTVVDNYADYAGGGVYVQGDLVLEATTVRGNAARDYGGGVYYEGTNVEVAGAYASTATFLNSTVTGNTAGIGGGGVFLFNGALRVFAATITSNAATSGNGGGVFSFNDDLTRATFKASVVVGNTGLSGAEDVYGVNTGNRFDSLGYNVIGAASGTVDFDLEFTATGDLTGVAVAEAGLASLADNGGPTWTHALEAGSVALDRVPSADCTDPLGAALPTDQRGVARPQGTNCDSGAFELEGGATEHVLLATVAPLGSGTVAGTGTYEPGATATLTAIPADQWAFSHWSGDLSGSDNPATLTMDANKTVVANFTQVLYAVTEILDGGGTVLREPAGSAYPYGTTVTVTAVPTDEWRFDQWSGVVTGSSLSESFMVTGAMAYTAHFTQWYPLTTAIVGEGGIARDPSGEYFQPDTTVTLTATPMAGWRFDHWSGDVTGSSPSATVTMDAAKTVTATFVPDTYTVSATVVGNGSVEGGGTYAAGVEVTLTATPDPGWTFDGWSGDVTSADNPLYLIVKGDVALVATFVRLTYALDVTTEGSGTVELNPATGPYTYGTPVALTPTAASGWHFDHWSGDLTGSDVPGLVTMDANKTVTATFVPNVSTYIVTTHVDGAGSVDGGGTYESGATATLTAVPFPGAAFDHWSGDTTGSTNPIELTVTSNLDVTAHFVLAHTLDVAVQGEGEVTTDPSVGPYADGTVVTLTATPAPGWFFQMWTGSVTGSVNPVTLELRDSEGVTAVFQPVLGPMLSVAIEGEGLVTSEPSGIHCRPTGGACLASFPKNTRVTLYAVADDGSAFLRWSGSTTDTAPDLTIRLRDDAQATAHFTELNGPVVAIDRTGSFRGSTAIVTGSLVCAAGSSYDLDVAILQEVPVKKDLPQLVSASTTVMGAACGQTWTATLIAEDARFVRGEAEVTVTVDGVSKTVLVQLR